MKRMIELMNGSVTQHLTELPDGLCRTAVTSPPYWGLRDYGGDEQIGLEKNPSDYIVKLTAVFREVRRVLTDDGTLWLNIGDSYAASGKGWGGGSISESGRHFDKCGAQDGKRRKPPDGYKNKDLVGIPWMLAFALRNDGWYLRQDIIWHKPNPMPESVKDRCTKAHEYLFLLSKSERYYFNIDALKEPAVGNPSGNKARKQRPNQDTIQRGNQAGSIPYSGGELRQRRDVWSIPVKPLKGFEHFATFPTELVEPCVLASTQPDDVVLDPFMGSGTVGVVSVRNNRHFVGIDLNSEYVRKARKRIEESTNAHM